MEYRKLEAWKQAMLLVKNVYEITRSFPKEEQFGLTSQVKRAAISIPANIAEGIGRNFKKETIQFLHISRGSLYELETLLSIGTMLKMVSQEVSCETAGLITKELQLLNGLIRYYEHSNLK